MGKLSENGRELMTVQHIGKLSEAEQREISETAYQQITVPKFTLPRDMTTDECIQEGLSGLTDYFEAALEGQESKAALRRMWDQQMRIINTLLKQRGEEP